MTTTTTSYIGHEQLSLLGGEAYELVIRVGIVPEADHVQIQFEARNVTTGDLLELRSDAHRDFRDAVDRLDHRLAEFRAAVHEHIAPF